MKQKRSDLSRTPSALSRGRAGTTVPVGARKSQDAGTIVPTNARVGSDTGTFVASAWFGDEFLLPLAKTRGAAPFTRGPNRRRSRGRRGERSLGPAEPC